jgi:FkbM family methyltransferase
MSLITKLWSKSPKNIVDALKAKIANKKITPQWIKVKFGPLKDGQLFIGAGSFEGWQEMINGCFDSFIYKELKHCYDLDGAVVWDIGAHFGYHSFSFASLVGEKGHVCSFEPNPYNIARFKLHLKKNVILAKRITLHAFALSDVDGEVNFVLSNDVDGSSSSGSHLQNVIPPLDADTYKNFNTQVIRTLKIDTFLETKGARVADIIKIDVEGAELLVLNGGKNFFKKHKPIIFMEVHNILMMFYVLQFLNRLDYDFKVLDEEEATLSRCFIIARPK